MLAELILFRGLSAWLAEVHLFPGSSHYLSFAHVCVLISSYKDISDIVFRDYLYDLILINCLFKAPIFENSPIFLGTRR